jgi:ABC-type uncharacterized transport system auxiliary subunit
MRGINGFWSGSRGLPLRKAAAAGVTAKNARRAIVRRISGARWIAVLAALALLGGCGGKIPPTNYYVLDLPAPEAKPPDTLPYTAVVMPFRASEMLLQDRIIFREGPSQVGFYEYHRWAEDPRTTILRSLLNQLTTKGTFQRVVAFEGRTNVDYVIRGRLEQLEEIDYGGSVSVRAKISAQLLDANSNRPVWSDTAEATGSVETAEVRAVVQQMSTAVRSAVGELAEGINTHLRSGAAQSAPASTRSAPAEQK